MLIFTQAARITFSRENMLSIRSSPLVVVSQELRARLDERALLPSLIFQSYTLYARSVLAPLNSEADAVCYSQSAIPSTHAAYSRSKPPKVKPPKQPEHAKQANHRDDDDDMPEWDDVDLSKPFDFSATEKLADEFRRERDAHNPPAKPAQPPATKPPPKPTSHTLPAPSNAIDAAFTSSSLKQAADDGPLAPHSSIIESIVHARATPDRASAEV